MWSGLARGRLDIDLPDVRGEPSRFEQRANRAGPLFSVDAFDVSAYFPCGGTGTHSAKAAVWMLCSDRR